MNLAARFATSVRQAVNWLLIDLIAILIFLARQANIGELDLRQTRRSLVLGNMALLQVQALLVSLLAGIAAFVLGLMSRHGLADSPAALTGHDVSAFGVQRGGYFEFLMVLCASMLAASTSSGVVGAFMCALVVFSRFLRINPGQPATRSKSQGGLMLACRQPGYTARRINW